MHRCITCNKLILPLVHRSAFSTTTEWDGEIVETGWLCGQTCRDQHSKDNWALYKLAMSKVPSGVEGRAAYELVRHA